jgi:hypothetical protein
MYSSGIHDPQDRQIACLFLARYYLGIPILQTDKPEHPEVYKHLSTPRETAQHTTFLTDFEYPTYPAVMKTNTIQIHKSQLESMPQLNKLM